MLRAIVRQRKPQWRWCLCLRWRKQIEQWKFPQVSGDEQGWRLI